MKMRSVFRSKETPPETAEDDALAKRFEGRVRLSWPALRGCRILWALLGPLLRAPQDGEAVALWPAPRERLSRLIARLTPSWPAPRTDRKDPYAIRAALLLTVAAAMLAAGGNVSDRLRAAFSPAASGTPALLRLDAWVTPPVYTGIAPIVLAAGSEKVGGGAEAFRALSVPVGGELIVRTHAPQGATVDLTTSRHGSAA